jgi:hypothetical protein
MVAEWSVECAAEDPVVVVPWKDPKGAAEFIDLRAHPYDLHRIPEAEEHQPLMQALRALNAPRSPVFTVKCDAWAMSPEEVGQMREDLDLDEDAGTADAAAAFAGDPSGFASYIDLIWSERSLFTSFHRQEQMLHRLVRHAAALERPSAMLDCILRPALLNLDVPQEGYAVSLYVKALGADPHAAWEEWAGALNAVAAIIRSKDLTAAAGNKARAG